MKDFNWKVMMVSFILCAIASAATPYVTLKLGQSVDLTIIAGMFLVAYFFANKMSPKELAVQLNITQTMIGLVSGIAFMVVILSAFYYIQNIFQRDVSLNLSTLQMFLWLVVSANLGIFMGIFPKRVYEKGGFKSLADKHIPVSWTITGIVVSVVFLVWMTSEWFSMPWTEVLLAVAIQPVLIVAGLRVLGITGSGPVSLMANATQFLYGVLWPSQIRSNLTAAYISANPQAISENVIPSFWVAQRLGGRFKTLILAQLLVVLIGTLLTPIMFNILEKTYDISLNPGQLSALTGLKIVTLA